MKPQLKITLTALCLLSCILTASGQITDAVTQTQQLVVQLAPAQATAVTQQVMAHTTAMAMQNAVAAQQQMNTISQAMTTQAVNMLLGMDVSAQDGATYMDKQLSIPICGLLWSQFDGPGTDGGRLPAQGCGGGTGRGATYL